MSIVLLITLLTLLYLFIEAEKDSLSSPPVLFFGGILLSVIMSLFMQSYYNYKISYLPFLLIEIFSISASVGFLFFRQVHKRTTSIKNSKVELNRKMLEHLPQRIEISFLVFLTLINVLIFILFWKDFSAKIGGVSGLANLNYYINKYRFETSFGDTKGISFLTSQFLKLARAISFSSGFCLCLVLIENKKIEKGKVRKILLLSINVIFYIVECLIKGQRFFMIEIMIFMFVVIIELLLAKYFQRKQKYNNKIIVLCILTFVFGCYLFSNSRNIVGRGGDSSVLEYFGSYFGSPIICLDIALKNSWNPTFTGANTFLWLSSFLSKFGLKGTSYSYFWYINGMTVGNVSTPILSYVQDYGFLSIPFFGFFIAYCLYSVYYLRIKESQLFNFQLFIYASMAYTAFMICYYDYFSANIIGLDFWINMLLCYVLLNFMFGKIKIRIGN